MMNVVFVLLAKRAFSDIMEGVNSNDFSFVCSLRLLVQNQAVFSLNNVINL